VFDAVREEVGILLALAVESLALMSVETTVISSKVLVILHHTVVIKSSETIFLVVTSSVSSIIALVLLQSYIGILSAWNIVTSDWIIMAA
jgi:hypothetical protein